MKFQSNLLSPLEVKSDCLIVSLFQHDKKTELSDEAKHIDKASDHYLSALLQRGNISGEAGTTLLLPHIPKLSTHRVLLVGCGKKDALDFMTYLRIIRNAIQALYTYQINTAVNYLTKLSIKDGDEFWAIKQTILACYELAYSSDILKTQKKKRACTFTQMGLTITNSANKKTAETIIRQYQAIANGIMLSKNLANLPPNICTPAYLAKQAQQLEKNHKMIKTTVLEEKDMQKLGMNTLLSVSKGSHEPAKLICIEYQGSKKKQAPVALVGKGVTFDSGGISLKPGANMDEMKFDMCGAASVLGTIHAAAELQLPIHIIGIIPATENLPDGKATRPGDIITSLSGQTVEILNTDAEGRLILCDALTYCKKYKPDIIIDIATLTGAIRVALGSVMAGIMSNDTMLTEDLIQAGKQAHDRLWQLPLGDEYQAQLDSNFADIANIGGPEAGSITGACFLQRFINDHKWAHIDIAGVAYKSGKEKGATGRPVALLTQYLINRCTNK